MVGHTILTKACSSMTLSSPIGVVHEHVHWWKVAADALVFGGSGGHPRAQSAGALPEC